MPKYQSRISASNDGAFYALVVRVDKDGYENVIGHYKGRYFRSQKAALKSTAAYISKFC